MKWLILLISPSSVWVKLRDSNWISIPILVGLVSALSNFYITRNPEVMYLKSQAILRLARSEFFTLPEGESIIRFAITLSFILLPLWYILRVIITGYITKLVIKNIDYKRVLLISSASILPLILVRIILTWFLEAKGFSSLSDLTDLNLTLGPVVFYAFNRDILKNDILFSVLREINLANIWSLAIFVSLLSQEKVSARYSFPISLVCISFTRVIEIIWEKYSYNIIWFFLFGG